MVPYRQANLVQDEWMRVHEGSAQRPRSLETMFVFNESLSDHFIAFVFPWLLRMLWIQFDFMMNFIENEFHWIREMRSLRTMCVKVITMTLRTLLLRLAAGALRGTRTYPNPWRAFLFCLPFLSFFFYLPLYPLLSKQRWLKGNVFRGEVECKHFRDDVECEHFSEFRIHEKCRFWQNSWKIWIMNCDFEEVLFQTSPDYYYYGRSTNKKRCFALQT